LRQVAYAIIERMPEGQNFQVSVIWPDVSELSVYRANQFIVQVTTGPDGNVDDVVLTIGYVAPPVILGTPEEQRASAMALGAVDVKALTRVSISPAYAQQLTELLQTQLRQLDPGSEDAP
jgi:hypothetical protein